MTKSLISAALLAILALSVTAAPKIYYHQLTTNAVYGSNGISIVVAPGNKTFIVGDGTNGGSGQPQTNLYLPELTATNVSVYGTLSANGAGLSNVSAVTSIGAVFATNFPRPLPSYFGDRLDLIVAAHTDTNTRVLKSTDGSGVDLSGATNLNVYAIPGLPDYLASSNYVSLWRWNSADENYTNGIGSEVFTSEGFVYGPNVSGNVPNADQAGSAVNADDASRALALVDNNSGLAVQVETPGNGGAVTVNAGYHLAGDGSGLSNLNVSAGSVVWNTNSGGTQVTNTWLGQLVYFDLLGNLHAQSLIGSDVNVGSGTVVGGNFSGSGSGLSALNASSLSSGTVAAARAVSGSVIQSLSTNFTGSIVGTNNVAVSWSNIVVILFTPKLSTSRVEIEGGGMVGAGIGCAIFMRFTTNRVGVSVGDSAGSRTQCNFFNQIAGTSAASAPNGTVSLLPGSTTAIECAMQFATESTCNYFVNRTSTDSNAANYGRGVCWLKVTEYAP